ncbi:succinate dehydrogenase, cytochrome b556 subunit [Brenneria tiliae]|uniref:Succinate dehydrogenase cytochrome b556 subunit n=1 Tax=Brenneria tiliae TaxID=2914984 RepID=A0ABT0MY65_9GAMM|nr:succinate dehydrogenase [Brenneria tiliae]MCL2894791.1 succinate dehydrogenase [Brenneria tiliae]
MNALRRQKGYLAFIGHRLSGLALTLFLPLHFLALGLALEGEAGLERVIRFSDLPLVKAAEWGLVVALGLHVSFGLRLLALEMLNWRDIRQARLGWIGWGAGFSLIVGTVFIMGVL